MLFELTCSLFLLGVVLEKVIGHVLDRVLRALLRTLGECLEQDRNHSFVEVSADGEILNVVGVTVVYRSRVRKPGSFKR